MQHDTKPIYPTEPSDIPETTPKPEFQKIDPGYGSCGDSSGDPSFEGLEPLLDEYAVSNASK